MMIGTSHPLRIARQVSRPPIPGMFISSRIRSTVCCAQQIERFFPALQIDYVGPLRYQRGAQDAANLWLVVNE